jgi:iron complex transport system permease protein
MTKAWPALAYLFIGLLTLLTCWSAGAVSVSAPLFFDFLWNGWHDASTSEFVILRLRLVRVLTSLLIGGGLAVCGSVLQRLLRNPLADPFVLGISAGGTTAAVFATVLGVPFLAYGIPLRSLAALGGCCFALFLLFLAKSRMQGANETYAIPVVGLILNAFFGALLMLIVAVVEKGELSSVHRWMMGSIQGVEVHELAVLALATLLPTAVLFRYSTAVNALAFGSELAISLGFDAKAIRKKALICVSMIIATVVSFCGSVGFIGLIVPHIARNLHQGNVRLEWFASFWIGASALAFADLFSRTLLAPAELPVGVFTAILGAPALAYILLRIKGVRT